MANTDKNSYSTPIVSTEPCLNSQQQDYLAQFQNYQFEAIQNRQTNESGFQPTSWSFPPNQSIYSFEGSNNSSRDGTLHSAASSYYYEETARSFSAAAAVAAVAAAAYISSSNAVTTSGYFGDPRSIKREPPQLDSTTKIIANYNQQAINSTLESNFGIQNTDSRTCPPKSAGYASPPSLISVPDAHSKPAHFLEDIHQPSRCILNQNSTKYSQFPNGSETNNFTESFLPQNSNLSDPVTSTPMPASRKRSEKPPAHVKKPLNAFMLFMKEMRAKVVAECTMKESAAINQILGRKWHALPHEEQAKFYEMARKEKERHQSLYPGWSARDNYAYHAKRRKNRCRYRVYNSNQGQSRDRSPQADIQDVVSTDKARKDVEGATTNVFKYPPLYKYPFPIGNMICGDQRYSSTDDLKPYFGFIDRNQQNLYQDQQMQLEQQQQQQSQQFGLNSQPADLESGAKEDCKPRLPGQFQENVETILSIQHFSPSTNWLLGNNHQPQLPYDLISSASTSPWSQGNQQIEDRFQRQISQPSRIELSNQYSTPPYNPNGSFDCHYNDMTPNYQATHKTSPGITDPHSSLKPANFYQDLSSKPTPFATCYGDPDNATTTPLYGFPPT